MITTSSRAWWAVAAGALLGGESRYGLSLLFGNDPGGLPWLTLTINIAGSAVLGFLTGWWTLRPAPFWLRAGIGPGMLGSFTTFSAVMFSVDQLAMNGHHYVWALYLVLSVLAGLAAAWSGVVAGRRTAQRRMTRNRANGSSQTC